MQQFQAKIRGVAPLMMHNERLADPTSAACKELKRLTSKRKKTDEDLEAIKECEWRGGMYVDERGAPAIPSGWVWASLIAGAKKSKLGPAAKAGIYDAGPVAFALEYDGPRTLDALYADGRFCDYRGVGVNGKRIMRARPVFPEWECTIVVNYDADTIDPSSVEEACRVNGQLIGLGDYRPRFGRYTIVEAKHVEV